VIGGKIVVLTVAAVMGVAMSAARVDAQQADAGGSPTTAQPLTTDQPAQDALDSPSDVDVFRVDVVGELTIVRVTIARTNDRCEVWGRLLDVDGVELGRVFVAAGATEYLSALAPTAGPYFLVIDKGPYADCSGARYRVELALVALPTPTSTPQPASPSGQQGQEAASTGDIADLLLCVAYSKRVDRLTTIVRRDRHERIHASGKRRSRLTRKLRHDRGKLRGARARANHYCASST